MPKKVGAKSPRNTSTSTYRTPQSPRGPQQYRTAEQMTAEQRGQGGDNPLTSVGGESPEKTEFERGRKI